MVFMVLVEGVGAASGETNANRVPMVSIPAAIAAGCAGSEWVGHMFHKPRTGRQRMSFLRVAEYNAAKGLRGTVGEACAEMGRTGLDVMVVTETGLLAKDRVQEVDGFKIVNLPATQHSVVEGGITILIRRAKGLVVEKVVTDGRRGRWVRVLVSLGGCNKVWICGAYGVSGPTRPDKQTEAMEVVVDWVKQVQECRSDTEHAIVASDSNFVKDSSADRCKVLGGKRVANTVNDASEVLYHHFVTESGLSDAWFECHGAAEGYTRSEWAREEGRVVGGSRIDHIHLSDSLLRGVSGVGVRDGAGFIRSDHHMIVVEICVKVVMGLDLRRHGMVELETHDSNPSIAFHKFDKDKWGEYNRLMREWWDSTGLEEWKSMGSGACDSDGCDEHVID